jgi:hypothetical protein
VVTVRIGAERDRLLSVRRGELPLDEVDAWRQRLHRRLEEALATSRLPERPDVARADAFLVRARRQAAGCA